jgi:hypothetical protein
LASEEGEETEKRGENITRGMRESRYVESLEKIGVSRLAEARNQPTWASLWNQGCDPVMVKSIEAECENKVRVVTATPFTRSTRSGASANGCLSPPLPFYTTTVSQVGLERQRFCVVCVQS